MKKNFLYSRSDSRVNCGFEDMNRKMRHGNVEPRSNGFQDTNNFFSVIGGLPLLQAKKMKEINMRGL